MFFKATSSLIFNNVCLFALFLCFFSCSMSKNEQVEHLINDWLAQDTVLIAQSKLDIRYKRASEYIMEYHSYQEIEDNGCETVGRVVRRDSTINFRVINQPLTSDDFSFIDNINKNKRFIKRWGCDVYNIHYDSLISVHDKVYNDLLDASSDLFGTIDTWQIRNSEQLTQRAITSVSEINSDTTTSHFLLFEYPTGKTLTAYTAWYPYLHNDSKPLMSEPEVVLKLGGDVYYFIFNQDDEIEFVWSIYWMS